MATITDTTAAQLESVRPILGEIFETSDQISALFKKNAKDITQLSRYLYRIPLQQYRGGTFAKYSANGGSLPGGTGMSITSLQAGFFYSIIMFQVTEEQEDLSQSSKQSIVNVMAKTLKDGMMEAAVYDDIALHGDGTGILTNASDTTNGTTQLTFNGATDTLGVSKLRPGMAVDVWDATGAAIRVAATAAPILISTIDDQSNTVTFNQTVTGLTATDVISFYGLKAYGPATLASFTAGWPATDALTTAAGLTNDSFRHGLRYAHDFNNSNYYLGKQKSALPQIAPLQIQASSQPLTWAHGFAMLDRIQKRRGPEAINSGVWIFPMCQRQVVFEEGVSISTKMIGGGQTSFGSSVDLAPDNNKYTDAFNFVNLKAYVSKRQDNDRVEYCNLSNWGRAEVFPLKPYEKQGRTVFEGRDTNGLLSTYSMFGFHSAYDFVCFDPGAEGAVTGLKIPSNY